MAKRRKAKTVKGQERLKRRMVKLLAWHGLTLEQAGQLSDAELGHHGSVDSRFSRRSAPGPEGPGHRRQNRTHRSSRRRTSRMLWPPSSSKPFSTRSTR